VGSVPHNPLYTLKKKKKKKEEEEEDEEKKKKKLISNSNGQNIFRSKKLHSKLLSLRLIRLADIRDLPQFLACIFIEIVASKYSSRAVTCKGGSTKRLAEETVDINGVCKIFLLNFQSIFHWHR
jgi:hypothetical protein